MASAKEIRMLIRVLRVVDLAPRYHKRIFIDHRKSTRLMVKSTAIVYLPTE